MAVHSMYGVIFFNNSLALQYLHCPLSINLIQSVINELSLPANTQHLALSTIGLPPTLLSSILSPIVTWHFHHAPLPSLTILTNSCLCLPTPAMDLTICGLRQLFCLVLHSHHVCQLFSWYHLTISAGTYRLMVQPTLSCGPYHRSYTIFHLSFN